MGRKINDIKLRKKVISLYNQGYTQEEIFKKLNITRSLFQNIRLTFSILDINEELKTGEYSKKEIEFMKKNLDKNTSFFIKEFHRDYESINRKRNGLKKALEKNNESIEVLPNNYNKKYSEEEIEFVKEAYERGDSLKEIALALGRKPSSIKSISDKHKFYRKKEEIEEGYKKCARCKEIKPISEFNKTSKSKDGYDCYCRICKSILYKKYKNNK